MTQPLDYAERFLEQGTALRVGASLLANVDCHSPLMYLIHRIRCPCNLGRLPRVLQNTQILEQTSNLWEPACWRMRVVIHR